MLNLGTVLFNIHNDLGKWVLRWSLFYNKETEAQRIGTNYSIAVVVYQALVLSISHKLTYLMVSTAL